MTVPKYMLLSVPFAAALILALLVGAITYIVLPKPTLEQIGNAQDYDKEKAKLIGPGGDLSPDKIKGLIDIMQGKEPSRTSSSSSSSETPSSSGAIVVKDDEETPGAAAKTPPEHKPDLVDRETYRKRHVVYTAAEMEQKLANTNRKLREKRDGALLTAKKAGAWTFFISLGLGYAGLIYYFYSANRNARVAWEQQMTRQKDIGRSAASVSYEQPYVATGPPSIQPETSQPEMPQADAPQPGTVLEPQDDTPIQAPPGEADMWAAAEGKYEPYEAPVDISELERIHDETVEREKRQGGNPGKT